MAQTRRKRQTKHRGQRRRRRRRARAHRSQADGRREERDRRARTPRPSASAGSSAWTARPPGAAPSCARWSRPSSCSWPASCCIKSQVAQAVDVLPGRAPLLRARELLHRPLRSSGGADCASRRGHGRDGGPMSALDVRDLLARPDPDQRLHRARRPGGRARRARRPRRRSRAAAQGAALARRAARRDPHHALPLRPHRRRRADGARDRRAGLLPGGRARDARRTSRATRRPASARSRATSPSTLFAGGEHLEIAGLCDRRAGHARPQPGPHHLRDLARRRRRPAGRRSSPATCSSRGPSGRVDLPGGDWDVLEGSIGDAARALSRDDDRCLPGAHGRHHARPRAARATRSCKADGGRSRRAPAPRRAARAQLSAPLIKAPRGTYDVLPEQAPARALLESPRPRRSSSRRGLRAHRDARLRGHRALRARRRRVDGHRAEGDVHVPRRLRALAHAAPRGHGAGLPRLPRARDAQASLRR